ASSSAAAPGAQPGMGDMGTTDGLPDMRMYGSAAPATAAEVMAAGQLIKQTDATLAKFANVRAAFAAGYTYVLRTNGEEHLLYDGNNPAYAGLDPRHPSSLVYAIDVPHHAPILLGAMYIEPDNTNGPQVGGALTPCHAPPQGCRGGRPATAGVAPPLPRMCGPGASRSLSPPAPTPGSSARWGGFPPRPARSPTPSAGRRPPRRPAPLSPGSAVPLPGGPVPFRAAGARRWPYHAVVARID